MKDTTTQTGYEKTQLDNHFDEISFFLIDTNAALIECERKELYEQCVFIQMAKELYFSSQSQVISSYTNSSLKEILEILKIEDDYIYSEMRKEPDEIITKVINRNK